MDIKTKESVLALISEYLFRGFSFTMVYLLRAVPSWVSQPTPLTCQSCIPEVLFYCQSVIWFKFHYFRYKFDDERVTKEDTKRALEEQYGGEEEVIWLA